MATDVRQPPIVEAEGTVLRGITWKTYLKLRDNPENYHVRMTYLDGTLTFLSPQYLHDRSGWKLALLVSIVTEVLDIPAQGTGTSTLRRQTGTRPKKGTGKEPDYGFYFRENELRMRYKNEINLDIDPPPDLAIEVDPTSDSKHALKLYADLGVPEIWRYRPKTNALWFGRLVEGAYESTDRSLNLPRLTPRLVVQALEEAERLGETRWKRWLRDWVHELPEVPENG
jgi:Uma2 family endonuclease